MVVVGLQVDAIDFVIVVWSNYKVQKKWVEKFWKVLKSVDWSVDWSVSERQKYRKLFFVRLLIKFARLNVWTDQKLNNECVF